MKTKFYYLGRHRYTHKGIVTAAVRFIEENKIAATFGFCAPGDSFSRHKAHQMLNGRLDSDLVRAKMHVYMLSLQEGQTPADGILHMLNTNTVARPRWAEGRTFAAEDLAVCADRPPMTKFQTAFADAKGRAAAKCLADAPVRA